jgi:hypothetical protein
MGRYSAVIVLMVLGTGCMHETKPQTQPPPVAAAPEKPKAAQPAAAAPATRTAKPQRAPATTGKTAAAPAAKPKPTAPARQPAAPALDLDALEARLKQTKAIGLMTKLSLKNQVDDLLDKFRTHYAGSTPPTMADLRRSYDLLMMKVLSLLQDRDQQLASDILSSRERIWGLLADPKKFAALQA